MSALADRWEVDPEALSSAALEAKRCECVNPVFDGDDCAFCGREIRAEGSLSRDFRTAAYMRRLSWAAGMGVPRSTGFRGLHDECGSNPALPTLDAALGARVEALLPVEGDPFGEHPELVAELMAA